MVKKMINEDENQVNKDIENQVIGQLDRSAKLDEIDTVTFGLETDDGKIVKVYVNADQANDFEKALAEKLGEVDDIEAALNDLSKDFEIVDVEWPDENDEEEDAEAEEGQPETDGSELMNKKVYGNDKEKAEKSTKAKMESKKYTFKSQVPLMEDGTTIESRMNTPTQLMMYHAIVELGIPEIALNKSPYKASIIQSIKHRALEINKNPSVKVQLKAFVQRIHDLDDSHHKHDKRDKKRDDHGHHRVHESLIEQLINESVIEDFWSCITKVIRYLSPDAKHADALLDSNKMKTLISRSTQMIPKVIKAELRLKTQKLGDSLDAKDAMLSALTKTKVSESTTPEKATGMFNDLFTLIDPTPTKSVSKTLLNSPEFKAYFMSIKPTLSQKFNGILSQKFIDFCKVLNDAAEENKPATTTVSPSMESKVPVDKILKEAVEWSFAKDGDNVVATTDGIKMTLDPEQLEKAVKAINTKNVIAIKDAENVKQHYTISPRGLSVAIKKVGDTTSYKMDPDQIQSFVDMITAEDPEPKAKKDDKKADKKDSKKKDEEE